MQESVLHIIDNMCLGGAQRIVSTLVENEKHHYLHSLQKSRDSMGNSDTYTCTESDHRLDVDSFLDCWRLLKRHDPEVLHCHLMKSKVIGILLKISSRKDFKLVFHEHGHVWKYNQSMYRRILKYSSKIVDLHIAVSEHTSKLLIELNIPRTKVEVLYNFVDRQQYCQEALHQYESELNKGVDQDAFTIGYGGRLEERKGWKSVVSVAEQDNDNQYLMAGSGTGEKELERKASEIDNLHYVGFVDDIRCLLANIDCFVLPSHWDPSPMILYEVQSCGIPLICADVKSINEIVDPGQNAIVYPSEEEDMLSEKITDLKTDTSLRSNMAEAGITNAKRYTFENFQNSINEIYSELISDG